VSQKVEVLTPSGSYHLKNSTVFLLIESGKLQWIDSSRTKAEEIPELLQAKGVNRFDTCWQLKRSPNRPWGVRVLQYVP